MLDCDKTITLVRRDTTTAGDTYHCTVIPGCSWQKTDGDNLGTGGEAPGSNYVIHIPAENMPGIMPGPGDYMVLGTAESVLCRRDLAGTTHFRISAVTDNRKGVFLRHVKVVGS